MTPDMLAMALEGRDREMSAVAYQMAMVARSFLSAYHEDRHDTAYYLKPDGFYGRDSLLDAAAETRSQLVKWWEEDGQDDPLDRVVPTYRGHAKLHEIPEREVWHTTQHVRQIQLVLERRGVAPDGPMTAADLEGLPLPERVHG
jgi:hypothetical protein